MPVRIQTWSLNMTALQIEKSKADNRYAWLSNHMLKRAPQKYHYVGWIKQDNVKACKSFTSCGNWCLNQLAAIILEVWHSKFISLGLQMHSRASNCYSSAPNLNREMGPKRRNLQDCTLEPCAHQCKPNLERAKEPWFRERKKERTPLIFLPRSTWTSSIPTQLPSFRQVYWSSCTPSTSHHCFHL